MSVTFGSATSVVSSTWTVFKTNALPKALSVQYDDDGTTYTVFAFDLSLAYVCTIWKGTVPESVISGGYSQATNDADKSDFETNYKPNANKPVQQGNFTDPRLGRRFGNLTATSTSEVLLSARAYVEQASEAQRSVQSSSAQDAAAGSGAKKVRITYLTSAYVLKTEDVTLNGTTKVNTIATDIRFVESFKVIQGAAAVGSIQLMTGTTGGATEFCGIGVGTYDAFLCHHYVPAGRSGFVWSWTACIDDETKFKLMGRATYGANIVDENWDLCNLMGIATPPSYLEFTKDLIAVPYGEKAYIRITVVPNQATTTIIRGSLVFWEV